MNWKPDRIVKLRGFVMDGLTASQIARELGISRSAVIGKCDRLGLKLKTPACCPTSNRASVRVSGPVVALLETSGPRDCKWPVWGDGDLKAQCPKHPPICGEPIVFGPYCARHAAQAYRSATGGGSALMAA